jgi:hypothetical protein
VRWGDECERMNASRRIPGRMRTNLPQTVSFSERRRQIIVTIKGATTCSPLHPSQRAKPAVTTCTRNSWGKVERTVRRPELLLRETEQEATEPTDDGRADSEPLGEVGIRVSI